MAQMMTLEQIRRPAPMQQQAAPVTPGFTTVDGFELLQRIAKMFNQSSMVPQDYRDPKQLGNTVIAVDIAARLGASPLLVMQNLYIVKGRPAWSAQFLIATFNASGKYSALRFAFQGKAGRDDWGCRAYATEVATNEKLEGPLITVALAKDNGWYSTNPKWRTMTEQMLRYRAAAWFVRTVAPEIALGLKTEEEVRETIELERQGEVYAAPEEKSATEKVQEHVEATPKRRGRKPTSEQPASAETPAALEEPAQDEEPLPGYVEKPPLSEEDNYPDYDDAADRFYHNCSKYEFEPEDLIREFVAEMGVTRKEAIYRLGKEQRVFDMIAKRIV